VETKIQIRVPEHMLLHNPLRAGTGLSSFSAGGGQDISVACQMTYIAWKQQYILSTDIAFILLEHLRKLNKCEIRKKTYGSTCVTYRCDSWPAGWHV
jgi:hypothetical protein